MGLLLLLALLALILFTLHRMKDRSDCDQEVNEDGRGPGGVKDGYDT